ncbi:OmpA family protein [Hydrogenovibrio halophilus]|uniref:OmpA family protein n=1 Tax=Hydrogenovibrio halophilus TaxID=373391 RepID=UPI00039CFBF8|nr:OmpA family protein [Hydrogenovibrio halophilus]
MTRMNWIGLSLAMVMLGGCSSAPTVPEDQRIPEGEGDYRDVDDLVRQSQQDESSVETSAEESDSALAEEDLTEADSLNKGELSPFEQAMGETYDPVIYFGYDQSQLDEASMATVQHFANILVDNPDERIKLIGHTDERGSQEYNLALGERRAQAVAEAFMLYGVSDVRMEIISMGETEPAAEGQTEKAWALNRRVEIEPDNE